jgi:hypothetical protein
MTDLEGYTLQHDSEFDNAVDAIVGAMPQNITQSKRAELFGVSIRTIQSFEKADGSCRNYKLLFCYRMHVYGDAVI